MSDDVETGDKRYPYGYDAFVVDNDDPTGHGRVRVQIPGLLDKSRWAEQRGTIGGGSKRRGFFSVPEVGALVSVWFNHGRIEHPRYIAGHWGSEVEGADDDGESTGTELPERVRDIPIAERKRVHVFETDKWAVVYDDRDGPKNDEGEPTEESQGENTLLIISKEDPNTFIELDAHGRGMQLSTTATLLIKSLGMIDIQALTLQLVGRVVIPNGKPIT